MNLDSSDVLARLMQVNRTIEAITLLFFNLLPPGDQRATLDEHSKAAVVRAREFRQTMKLPFWDGAMVASWQDGHATSGLFAAAAFHNRPLGAVELQTKSQLSANEIRERFMELSSSQILAVSSRVRLFGGGVAHIPMLDFHPPACESTLIAVRAVIDTLGLAGYLLASGKSYHFIGMDLLAEHELPIFLGRALLFAPIVDRTWVGHQLIEGASALRISPRLNYGASPQVVEVVGAQRSPALCNLEN